MADFSEMGPAPGEFFGPEDYDIEAIEAAEALGVDGPTIDEFDVASGGSSYAAEQVRETLELQRTGQLRSKSSFRNLLGVEDEDWMEAAKCKDLSPSVFFPTDGVGVQQAQRICGECAVAEACLDFALRERIDHGVWGGKSERERRRIVRRRRN